MILVTKISWLKESNHLAAKMTIIWKSLSGRKEATRLSETVGNESDDTDDEEVSVYQNMKKHELREECVKRNLPASGAVKCIIKRFKENDDLKEEVKKNQPNVDKLCESCEENPGKLYESPASKWFCKDCNQYIAIFARMPMRN